MTAESITEDTPFVPEDDTYHQPLDDPHWVETNWWSFNVPERRIGGWLHCAYATNRGTATWRVFAWDDTGTSPARMAYHRTGVEVPMPADPDLRDITFPGGGYSVRMLTPLMDYAVGYRDAEAGFGLEFEHRSVHPPRRFTPGQPPAMFNPHLDQLGRITGELVLHGERIPLDCWSIRDRTWGPRPGHHAAPAAPGAAAAPREFRVAQPGGPRWREIERERGRGRIQYVFGHTDDRTGFLGFVRPQDGDAAGWSPMNVGWLLRDGEFQHLDRTRSRLKNYRDPATGWSQHMEVDLVDVTGRTMQAEGFAVSRMSEQGHGANSLMRWEYDGKVGWGEDQDGWRLDHFQKMLRALRAIR